MTDTQVIATVVAAVAGPQGLMLLAGHVANHPENVRRSWQDGRAWLAARAADARTAQDMVRRYVTAAARGVGRVSRVVAGAVRRAHGRHRMGVRA
ncbi:hypothetical protein ACWERV_17255 [Streptomyces sp. NPDC004031]